MSRAIDVLAEMNRDIDRAKQLGHKNRLARLVVVRDAFSDLLDAVERVNVVLVDRKGHEFLDHYGFTFHNLQRALARAKGGVA